MALTDAKIRAAKPTDKAYKLTDGAGMFLLVHPNGSRYWRLRYRILGKEKTLALGGFAPIFPDICYHLTHYKPAAADIPVAS
ncbi:Arm DNA-binding domain-containing protein, partial [Escherichia coli]